MANTKFDSNDILIAEFEYISKTASEANNDRERIVLFYNLLIPILSVSIGFLVNSSTASGLANNIKLKTEGWSSPD